MIRHLLRIAWRRRGANALLGAELGGAFLVLALLATACWQLTLNWRRPLGFEPRDAWVAFLTRGAGDEEGLRMDALVRGARASRHVLSAAASSSAPYEPGEESWQFGTERGLIDAEMATVGDEALEVLGLTVADGRWFRDGDEGLGWRPVVVDRDFARAMRRDGRVVGEPLPGNHDPEMRIVGVVEEFRRRGEAAGPRPFLFLRRGPAVTVDAACLILRMRPGTPASAEPELLRDLKAAAPGAQIDVRRLEDVRSASLRDVMVGLTSGAILAGFLVSMVALGLLGVLWQNVARRTQEIGLRRALGATPGDVRTLVVGEVAVVTFIALAIGAVVVAQVAMLSLLPGTGTLAHGLGAVTAASAVCLLALLCSLHPARLATRVAPAQALRQE